MTAKKRYQSILAFKAGQVLLTRKNGADIGFKIKKLPSPSLIANGLQKHRFGDQVLKVDKQWFFVFKIFSRSAIGAGRSKGKVF